ncbi:hypothetical protein HNP55_000380 [Paucibacter oligotrophus]|uniref:Uncharacterized protein n=1 Tax=Roseateles oligotrophus TaxID=1769250 RepID=A0A840L5Q3_9BURK|nr:hypothetical protein [Roseateles oligotrophus]MBB4841885.1 hypothetical protein [Roseateles oligotrophus]
MKAQPSGEPEDIGIAASEAGASSRLARWAMAVIWPSFVMAGVMEALVFAVIDPSDLSWFGAERMALSRQAIYTLSFLIFWLLLCLSSSVSLALATAPEPVEGLRRGRWPQ